LHNIYWSIPSWVSWTRSYILGAVTCGRTDGRTCQN